MRQVLMNLLSTARKTNTPPERLARRVVEILDTDPVIPKQVMQEISIRLGFIEKLVEKGQIEAGFDEIARMIELARPYITIE